MTMRPPSGSDRLSQWLSEGVAFHRQGRIDDALRCYHKVLKKLPRHFTAAYLAGVGHLLRGEPAEARRLLAVAVNENPTNIDAQADYGTALAMTGAPDAALAAFDRALAINPRHPGACLNRANTLATLNRLAEALDALATAHAADPSNPQIPCNRGNVLAQLGRLDEAVASCGEALALRGDFVEAMTNRGNTLLLMNRNAEALDSYQQALRLRPDDADAHYGASFVHLRLGDFTPGWREYEWRWRRTELAGYRRDLGHPAWDGTTALAGQTLLLHAEQGLGDTIHFVRYAPLLADRGARIVLEVQPSLKPLIAEMPGSTVVGRGERLPPFDLHCPLLSLPLVTGTTAATIPAEVPYLAAPAARIDEWRERLSGANHLKVGVAWSGNRAYRNDRHRSMALRDIAPLLSTPGVAFYTLNPDLPADEAEFLAGLTQVTHIAGHFRDFADTAAVVHHLDLVVTTDTSIPHLAGAMGKEVWIMLGFAPDWRWLLDREDSPWYPTATLFRQEAIGAWGPLVARIGERLAARARQVL